MLKKSGSGVVAQLRDSTCRSVRLANASLFRLYIDRARKAWLPGFPGEDCFSFIDR
jgi:hypothetical protein